MYNVALRKHLKTTSTIRTGFLGRQPHIFLASFPMNYPALDRTFKSITLEDGSHITVEVTNLGGRQKVGALESLPLTSFLAHIQSLAATLGKSVSAARTVSRASKATIEFGLEMGVESGQLTALLVKGSGSAAVRVVLEWDS